MTAPSAPRGPTLRLVCVNDIYTFDTLPRLHTLVQRAATVDPADLLLVTLAGDFVSPSLLSSLDQGRGMVDCLNAVPVTHVTFGNHEDDIPTDALRQRVREFNGTWLATNVIGFDPALPPYQILDLQGPGTRRIRVGLLGVVMNDPNIYRALPFGGAAVLPASDTARCVADHLVRAEGCACVIPLTHQNISDDRALADLQRDPPFPVILGGHEHVVFLEQLGNTWLIKAGSDAVHAAIVDLTWPADPPPAGAHDLPAVQVRLEDTASYADDPALRARVSAHMRAVTALEEATLMHLQPEQILSSVGTRRQQTSMGTCLCSRLRDALGAEGCIFNGGGIRAGRHYRQRFTYGDLKAEVPFENPVVVASLPGRVLREAIAFSRLPAESGGFLQVDDRMTIAQPGNQLVAIHGQPLDEHRLYRIALVRNLFEGMDHNEPLIQFARDNPDMIPPRDGSRDVKVLLIDAFARVLWTQLGPFEAIDTNHDGQIDTHEIASAVARVTAEPASPITVDLLLKTFDTDHDRLVSRQEAADGVALLGGPTLFKNPEQNP